MMTATGEELQETPSDPAPSPAGRRHVPLRVDRIVDETAQARSFVLRVPPEHADDYAYRAGQYLTVRMQAGGVEHARCYSMSSAPATDDAIKITVKRQPGGRVSNWMHDELEVGDTIDVLPPAGLFTLRDGVQDVLAFASGSGITPVLAIVKTVLATTDRRVRLFYANQDRDAVIFSDELRSLGLIYRHRFSVVHHLYDEKGFVAAGDVAEFLRGHRWPDVYVCGSRHFRATVLSTLSSADVAPDRVFVESFTPGDEPAASPLASDAGGTDGGERTVDPSVTEEVVLKLRGRRHRLAYQDGDTLLETARRAGLAPPFACESGTCASCMAHLKEGEVTMTFNSALTPDEVDEGWVLTCQGHPLSRTVAVEYPG